MNQNNPRPIVTVPSILSRKKSPDKISALTAYDYTSAVLLDRSEIDIVLVGDSLGNVIQGHSTTLPVSLDEMIYHCRCVSRGVSRALVVGDMPFMSYQVSTERAIESACRLIKEGGVAAVKLEGGVALAATVRRMVELDIPVMGHVGLTPQSVHRMGGFRVQGKENASHILRDAQAIADAGAFALVIEGVPEQLAREISDKIAIPTIGIGAGQGCDGQILVFHDLLGFHSNPVPRFVRQYASFYTDALAAIDGYVRDVKAGAFPNEEEVYR